MNKSILLTCTTFLSKPNKFNQLTKLLDSVIKYNKQDFHLIGKFLIINEYGENTNKIILKLKKKYPFFLFINKSIKQKGQAKSLNMIIDILKTRKYKYWLHLEESWLCNGNFIKDAYDVLENSNVSQLQLTNDWYDEINNKECFIINKCKKHIEIKITDIFKKRIKLYEGKFFGLKPWPLFSLRPGIDRINDILNSGIFNENSKKWPIQFEFEFALQWIIKNDITKAILIKPKFLRQHNHVSTYNKNSNNNINRIFAIRYFLGLLLIIVICLILFNFYRKNIHK